MARPSWQLPAAAAKLQEEDAHSSSNSLVAHQPYCSSNLYFCESLPVDFTSLETIVAVEKEEAGRQNVIDVQDRS